MNATAYHETVDELRREIYDSSAGFHEGNNERRERAYAKGGTNADRDAYTGCLMAANYAYTLAAILGEAARFGPEVQQHLAAVADDILMNGDDHNRNGDVMPAYTATCENRKGDGGSAQTP